jgi:hypothetical protein
MKRGENGGQPHIGAGAFFCVPGMKARILFMLGKCSILELRHLVFVCVSVGCFVFFFFFLRQALGR